MLSKLNCGHILLQQTCLLNKNNAKEVKCSLQFRTVLNVLQNNDFDFVIFGYYRLGHNIKRYIQ